MHKKLSYQINQQQITLNNNLFIKILFILLNNFFHQRHEHILLVLHEDVFSKMVRQALLPNTAPRQSPLEGSPV